MICFPNAKINLGLHVLEKRSDGFHNIETVLYPVALCDILEIIPSKKPGVEFTTSGIPVPGDHSSNLVMKAYHLLQGSGFRVHLHKCIFPGSGLGGGSSDGAHTIKILNSLRDLKLSVAEMQQIAGQLGSDCPFFIENKPALASGRGDMLEPIQIDLSAYRIVVEIPAVHVNTAEAYSMITPRIPEKRIREIVQLPVEIWKDFLINDFEEPVINKYPVIDEVKKKMYQQGAVYAAMSGSGSAVFGIFS